GGRATERVSPRQLVGAGGGDVDAPADGLAQGGIAVGEAGAGVAGDRGAALAREDLAVDGVEAFLVFLDDDEGSARRVGGGAVVGHPGVGNVAAAAGPARAANPGTLIVAG